LRQTGHNVGVAVTTITISTPPERVFDVLADARCYPKWVVGTQEVARADEGFPEVGRSFYPRVGLGPLLVDGTTTVLESARPHRLVLHARAHPVADALVTLELVEADGGTRVTMQEEPAGVAPLRFAQHLGQPLLRRRNETSLRRLKDLAERDA
jgi:uncharacterized protein YndB with AHSA1/START domain